MMIILPARPKAACETGGHDSSATFIYILWLWHHRLSAVYNQNVLEPHLVHGVCDVGSNPDLEGFRTDKNISEDRMSFYTGLAIFGGPPNT